MLCNESRMHALHTFSIIHGTMMPESSPIMIDVRVMDMGKISHLDLGLFETQDLLLRNSL